MLCYKPGEIGQALLAFVLTGSNLNESEIDAVHKKKLVPYMVPQVILIESVPLLVNGKVDRQTLLKSYENASSNGEFFIIQLHVNTTCRRFNNLMCSSNQRLERK